MSNKNKAIIVSLLAFISVFLLADVIADYESDGVGKIHIIIESLMSVVCLGSSIWIWKKVQSLTLHNTNMIKDAINDKSQLAEMTEKYLKMTQGLSVVLEKKFDEWKLTSSEREIGILLIKGNSLKEIAQIRETSEATVRQQTVKLYEKSGLAGRAEFSAYFLQDYLNNLA